MKQPTTVATAEAKPNCAPVPGSTAALAPLKLTPKEEMAVVVERVRYHKELATDEAARVRLDLAADLIRAAIHRL